MKSRKYPTFNYWGWEGQINGYYIYTFKIGVEIYDLAIFKDGKVEIRD